MVCFGSWGMVLMLREDSYYTLCDICGRKIRAYEATLIQEKYNPQNNLVVCPYDLDESNSLVYYKSRPEQNRIDPRITRSEGTDTFIHLITISEIEGGDDTSAPTGRTPGVPRELIILGGAADKVTLYWQGPLDSGSSAISGYLIERESPVGGGFATVTTTTIPATYYEDTSVSASTQYNYRVSSVNAYATGSISNRAVITTSAS